MVVRVSKSNMFERNIRCIIKIKILSCCEVNFINIYEDSSWIEVYSLKMKCKLQGIRLNQVTKLI